MAELVSIILPIYNVEKYLEFCLNSIINQTYKNLEIILVDDGSPDSCGLICDNYLLKDSRIKVIHQKNQGVVVAFEKGLQAATGEYIMRVDPDDAINCHMVSELLKVIKETDADIAKTNNALGFYKNDEIDVNEKLSINKEDIKIFSTREMMEEFCFKYTSPLIPTTKNLYKRFLFNGVICPPVRRNDDEWMIHQLVLNATKIARINKRMYYYRFSPEGMTRNFSLEDFSGIQALINRIQCIQGKGGYEDLISPFYMQFFEKAQNYYTQCKKHGLNCKKQLKGIRKELKKGYNIGIKPRTDLYSRKTFIIKRLFCINFILYDIALKILKI